MTDDFKWQCIFVMWGDKYAVSEINKLVSIILTTSSIKPQFFLLTDKKRKGLDPRVLVKYFPQFYLQDRFLQSGCQAKLAIFEKEVLEFDLPTIYLDVDTVILSDIKPILMNVRANPKQVSMLPATILSFGIISKLLWWLSKGKIHARGNSSILVFRPSNCRYIAKTFRKLIDDLPTCPNLSVLNSDDRFISWICQLNVRIISNRLAVKFPREYMLPWIWLIYLRQKIPWIKTRRRNLKVVTLPGLKLKPANFLELKENDIIIDTKGRRLIWNDRALGSMKHKLIENYKFLK